MKKTMAFLLTLVVLVMCMATTAFAAEVGDTVQVPITVSGNPGFGSYTIQLSYDSSALKLVGLSNAGNLGSNVGAFMPAVASNRASFFTTTQVAVEGDGTLFVASFEVLDGAQAKTYTIGASFIAGSDELAQPITLNVFGGSVTVTCDHVAGAAVKENEKAATCGADGGYDTVVYCSECKAELSRVPTTIPATGNHTAGAAVKENEKAATCGAAGSYDEVVYCTGCGKEMSRDKVTVPATEKHTAGAVVVENNVDATCNKAGSYENVTYCTGCGKEMSRDKVTVPATGEHKNTEIRDAKEATCTTEGYTGDKWCKDCNTKLETGTVISADPSKHVHADPVKENVVEGNCKTKHTYEEVVYCSVCNAEISRTKVTGELGGHNYVDGKCTICGAVKDTSLDNQPDTGDIFVEIALYASFAALAVGAVVYAKRKVRD